VNSDALGMMSIRSSFIVTFRFTQQFQYLGAISSSPLSHDDN
jgi:hypothetical protein